MDQREHEILSSKLSRLRCIINTRSSELSEVNWAPKVHIFLLEALVLKNGTRKDWYRKT